MKSPMISIDKRRLRPILGGMKQFVCGYSPAGESVGGNALARYCYSVWLRHLILLHKNGFEGHPRVVAELGPGDSLGTGIAALLSGVDEYFGLDVVPYCANPSSAGLLDDLADLFRRRVDIPAAPEFPELQPQLESYRFPDHILTPEHLARSLSPERIARVRRAIENVGAVQDGIAMHYYVPWTDNSVIRGSSVDMAFSQAVMEHVEDINSTYEALSKWLRPGGVMSHQVDFRSHGLASEWNGHWSYGDLLFRLAKGRRPYLLNRQPKSAHTKAARGNAFQVIYELPVPGGPGISRKHLASRFRDLTDDDLSTEGLFLVCRKPQ